MNSTPEMAEPRYPPAIPRDRIVEVAKLAGIPDDRIQFYVTEGEMQHLLGCASKDYFWHSDRLALKDKIDSELELVAREATKLTTAIAKLGGGARYTLAERIDKPNGRFFLDAEAEEGVKRLYNLVQQIETLRDAARPNGRNGAPRRHERHRPLDLFIEHLERKIISFGGKTTFSKNDGTGTLAEIFRILAPHLPAGFFPDWILNPDGGDVLNGASRIFHVKQQAARDWSYLCDGLANARVGGFDRWGRYHGSKEAGYDRFLEMAKREPASIGNAILISGRFCNFRIAGSSTSRAPFYWVAPGEDGKWLSRKWTKTPWKKDRFLS